MNALKFILFFLAILLALTSCSTGPDFERDNPYDRNPDKDSLGLKQFPPADPDKYIFTHTGLKVNLFKNIDEYGKIFIFRKNGNSEFMFLDSTYIQPVYYNGVPKNGYYLDKEIIRVDDIGYPLIYNLLSITTGKTTSVEIDFGNISKIQKSINSEEIKVSWQDSVFLNHGFQILRKNNGNIFEYIDLSVPDNSFSIPLTEEYLSSEYLITPYKFLNGEKTYLDTTYYYPTSPPPTNFNFEIINGKNLNYPG